LLLILDIDHGDIEEFLSIKDIGSPIQNLFTGVCVPDYWMQDMIDGDMENVKSGQEYWKAVSKKGFLIFSSQIT
jgi:ribonucleoside-diphosphate reductase alpha chain